MSTAGVYEPDRKTEENRAFKTYSTASIIPIA